MILSMSGMTWILARFGARILRSSVKETLRGVHGTVMKSLSHLPYTHFTMSSASDPSASGAINSAIHEQLRTFFRSICEASIKVLSLAYDELVKHTASLEMNPAARVSRDEIDNKEMATQKRKARDIKQDINLCV